jgi:tetratricopeptide (TPR) repeat protein
LKKYLSAIFVTLLGLVLFSEQCAYFNTFYNAQQYFKQGQQAIEENKQATVPLNIQKMFNSAIEKANKVLLNYPESRWVDDALYLIAMSHYYKMDYLSAQKTFEEFFTKYPDSPLQTEAKIWYGRCLWKSGQRELALYQLDRSAKIVDNDRMKAEIYSAIAELYKSSGQLDSAKQYFKLTSKFGLDLPIAAKAQYTIAEINLLQGNTELAIKNLEDISKYSVSPELKDQIQILLARIYRESHRYEEARELINTKLNDEKNESIWGDLEYELGLLYLDEKDYEAAYQRFIQITEKYPNQPVSASAYYQAGNLDMVYFHDYDRAQKNFTRVSQIDKSSMYAFDANNRVVEINRYFSIKKLLDKTQDEVRPIIETLRSVESNTQLDSSENVTLEETKIKVEKPSTVNQKVVDTTAVFTNYYKQLYEIGEIYYFNFDLLDSALSCYQKIWNSPYFNSYREQALYAMYYLYAAEGDSGLANSWLDTLRVKYPDSPYLTYIEKKEITLPDEELHARRLFWNAEKWFDLNPDSSISIFIKIKDSYPQTYYAEKSVYSIAWIYQNKYYDLENALNWYKYYIETYPQGDNFSQAQSNYNALNSIAIALNTPPDSIGIKIPKDAEELHPTNQKLIEDRPAK